MDADLARVEESDEEIADTWQDILDLSADIAEPRGPSCSSRESVATAASAR
jgi:hypothetical protein